MQGNHVWPLFVKDQRGNSIYLTQERWEHALDHPGMSHELLEPMLKTICSGTRKQDPYDPAKFKYTRSFPDLPIEYTHIIVVVKFGWQVQDVSIANNFVLTAYMVERW